MGRLHQIAWVLAVIALGAYCVCSVYAAEVCSLKVRVLTPEGQRPETPVSVEETNGRVENKDQENEDVSFCDLGLLPVTVKVGSDGLCNGVIIRDVPISWDQPYLLTVMYDPEACRRLHTLPPPVPVCRILFRVADSGGNWITAAKIEFLDAKRTMLKVDRYGRASMVASDGEEIQGSVTAPRFRPATFKLRCSQSEPLHEELVKLGSQ